MVIEHKVGRTFSLRVLLRANFVFLFSKFSSVLRSLHTVPPRCSLSFFSSPPMVLFAPLLVTPVCVFLGGLDAGRMRVWEEQALKVVSAAGPGLFQWI